MTKAKKTAKKNSKPANGVLGEMSKLYDFMNSNQLEALEYKNEDLHVRLVRKKAVQLQPVAIPSQTHQPKQTPETAHNFQPQAILGTTVKSPMAGIFYRSSSPASPPFVREGDKVKAGHVLCLIEAMKVFNEVKAEHDCVVLKVLVDNGKPVKATQDLFLVEKV